MKIYQIILIVFFIGVFWGYTWHYQATKNLIDSSECTWNDIPIKTVMLNNKIPAKIIEVNYERVN